jgi:hypothetical protein
MPKKLWTQSVLKDKEDIGGTRVWTQCFVLGRQLIYLLSYTYSPFFFGYFQDRILGTICWGWPRTVILLISASQVAKIASVIHWLTGRMIIILYNKKSKDWESFRAG